MFPLCDMLAVVLFILTWEEIKLIGGYSRADIHRTALPELQQVVPVHRQEGEACTLIQYSDYCDAQGHGSHHYR